ncbi:MAG: AbrB/MazE/SpoVT family DNA-binding domain-containing protein [Candidatus Aenigmarchaeota archaeon]|nr:AbrB/MazE/SpoVT family DNA-binding domain-containing protein [Candidatus Aenigmarchaeota archaeon]
METTTKPRKWGNSLGITIPKEIVEKEGITLRDELIVDIKKKRNVEGVKKLFGKFKFKKSTQEIKDEMRKGWE